VSALTAREYYPLPDSLDLKLFTTQWHSFNLKMKSEFLISSLHTFLDLDFISQRPHSVLAFSKLACRYMLLQKTKKKKKRKIRHHVGLPTSILSVDSVPSHLTEKDQPVLNEIMAGVHSWCQKMESMPKAPECKHTLRPLKGIFMLSLY